MLNWDVNSLSKKQEEMIKLAEREHLAQEVIDESRKANPHYNPTLAWVGHRIMDVGVKLVQISGSEEDRVAHTHLN